MRLPGWRGRGKETWGSQSNNDKDAPDYPLRSWLVVDVCVEEKEIPILKKAHVGLIMELHAGIWAGFFLVFVSGVLFFFSFNLAHYIKINCQKALWKLQFLLAQGSLERESLTWLSVAQSLYQGTAEAFPRQQFVSLLAAEWAPGTKENHGYHFAGMCIYRHRYTCILCICTYICRKGKCVMI